ncbi:hypothetical protein ASF16_24930 [Acidovorax sp. Leaf78]|nr:hypothetical protein ASF16_24930 [Acidovorax sp. Leaf78]
MALLLAALALWFLAVAPMARWITWSKADQEIAALEAAAEQDEKISPIVVYSTIRRLEAEAFAQEKTLTATGLITLWFVVSTIQSAKRRRNESAQF